CARKQANFDNW
nr:immunoglobulin heavy chain junction region [Macaca mulatta]MOV51601.1 immunoglobulin heavy chain junction region [Macaca mulatta]